MRTILLLAVIFQDFNLAAQSPAPPDTPANRRGEPDPNDVSIFTAVREQLGLALEPHRAAVEMLVIDHVEPPSEN